MILMRKFAIGLLSGVILSFATGAIAASSEIKAILFPSTIHIHQDNQTKGLTGSDAILNYKDSIYIPLRSFSESTGAAVLYTHPASGSDDLPKVDIYAPRTTWKSIWMAKGNMPTSPLALRLGAVNEGDASNGQAIGIYAELYNTNVDTLLISKAEAEIKIERVGGEGSPELVWTGKLHSPGAASTGEWIPGSNDNMVWGIQSPMLYWDKKDQAGNAVASGQYQVSLTNPVTVGYSAVFSSQEGEGSQVIQPDLSNTITIYIP